MPPKKKGNQEGRKMAGLGFTLPVFIAVFLASILFFAFFYHPSDAIETPGEKTPPNQKIPCAKNDTLPCKINACGGTRYCIGGQWSECTLKGKCVSGAKIPCYENSCTPGYRVCDECGDFGACIYDGNKSKL